MIRTTPTPSRAMQRRAVAAANVIYQAHQPEPIPPIGDPPLPPPYEPEPIELPPAPMPGQPQVPPQTPPQVQALWRLHPAGTGRDGRL